MLTVKIIWYYSILVTALRASNGIPLEALAPTLKTAVVDTPLRSWQKFTCSSVP